jgi:hypothetical protein
MPKLVQLKGGDLKPLREKWWNEGGRKCPILDQEIPFDETVVDHQHKLKAEKADETGKGICRGCLSSRANAWEGKITNSFKRLGLYKYTDIVTALRNLADYLEKNHIHTDDTLYIHPNEAPRRRKVKKACYNKLISAMKKTGDKRKRPKYTGNESQTLTKLMEEYDIEIEFYGVTNEDSSD